MRRGRLVAAAALCVAAAVLWVALRRPLAVAGEVLDDGFARASGVVHVHTTFSDGGGSAEAVIAAAQRAGLDFVVITDHNTLDAKSVEGYHGRLLVLVGTEVSTTAGHVVGLGVRRPTFRFSGDALDALEDVRDLGGVAFAAHPLSQRPDLRWTGWDLPGPWGLELLNGDSQWREAGWRRLAMTAALYGVNRRYALLTSLTPVASSLARWDTLLAQRFVAGIAGADAHERLPLYGRRTLPFPSYEAVFGLAQNHVLLERAPSGRAEEDAAALVSALSRGRSYVGLDALAPAGGFYFVAEGGGRRYAMGDAAPVGIPLRVRAGGRIPTSARVVLLRDGREVADAAGALDVPCPGAGVYRVEVRVSGWPVPWILSNPIEVFSDADETTRRRRAEWPAAPQAPPTVVPMDPGSFAAEADSQSLATRESLGPKEGPGGAGGMGLRFRLGTPGPAHPFVSCALVSRAPRDLSGRHGLAFSLKADGVFRVWVQVRDVNPASADEGTEWWFASVKTSETWARVSVPFDRLRSINPRSDGRLDLDKVRMIAFILDQGAVPPGTSGRFWVAGLGLY